MKSDKKTFVVEAAVTVLVAGWSLAYFANCLLELAMPASNPAAQAVARNVQSGQEKAAAGVAASTQISTDRRKKPIERSVESLESRASEEAAVQKKTKIDTASLTVQTSQDVPGRR